MPVSKKVVDNQASFGGWDRVLVLVPAFPLFSAQAWAAYYQQYYAQAAAANQAGAAQHGELESPL